MIQILALAAAGWVVASLPAGMVVGLVLSTPNDDDEFYVDRDGPDDREDPMWDGTPGFHDVPE